MTTNKQIKSLLVLLLALFLVLPGVNGQDLRLDFQPAFSIPVGNFAAKSLDGGSFALAGFSGGIGLQWTIKSGFSVRIQAAAASIPLMLARWVMKKCSKIHFWKMCISGVKRLKVIRFWPVRHIV